MAELGPVPAGRRLAELTAVLESLPRLGEADADALAADLDQARAELDARRQADPWAS